MPKNRDPKVDAGSKKGDTLGREGILNSQVVKDILNYTKETLKKIRHVG